ncbi:putative Peptidase A1 domain-containing protein [Seiridium cardinale]|uniref:Peptidase A1 domain-containing protein n=1 Tax=Seiridium cardinale TaxID=138064 RepID=A0ABR2Y9I1_9PEZI
MTFGSDQQISLYPGGMFPTTVFSSDYCNHNDTCYARRAGTYDVDKARLAGTGSTGGIQIGASPRFMAGVDIVGDEDATYWVDDVDLEYSEATTVPTLDMAYIENSYAAYPNGNWYPMSVGCLSLGSSDINQSWSNGNSPNVNASLIPGYLYEHNRTDSYSFGLHIGATNPQVDGSLYYGGYDQNRVLGKVLTMDGSFQDQVTLNDISIQVIDGSSPFDFGASQTGLLAEGNSSLGAGIKVSVAGCSPYLSLPTSTCNAIAQHLPVTYNEGLGLFTWNTEDPQYTRIVSSASALQFTLVGMTNTDKLNISVPFRHLNLTLDAPLVSTPTPYFPCYTGHQSGWVLGRAFLQDAFIGANWLSKSWWLAQAPGPNIPAEANVGTIKYGDTTITSGGNDWKESWTGSWTALAPSASPAAGDKPSNGTDTGDDGASTSGLTTGAKAGVGAGVGVAGLAGLGVLAFFLLRRRKGSQDNSAAIAASTAQQDVGKPEQQSPHTFGSTVYNSPMTAYPHEEGYAQQYGGYMPQQQHQQYSAELPGAGLPAPQELPAQYAQTYASHPSDIYTQTPTDGTHRY